MSTPINLRSEFGHRWKIGLDEAAGGRWSDPWNYKVLCRYGDICPWGGDLLAASTISAGAVANRLRRLPFVEVAHDGSDGVTVVFPRGRLSSVTGIMKPRRARTASPTQLAALERGRVRRPRSQ
jgi:hypothetical protein